METVVDQRQHKAREARLRRLLRQNGYTLQKSRSRYWSLHNQLGYRIINVEHNLIVVGANFDWSIDDVEAWVNTPEEGAA